jgi:hypothetical protein
MCVSENDAAKIEIIRSDISGLNLPFTKTRNLTNAVVLMHIEQILGLPQGGDSRIAWLEESKLISVGEELPLQAVEEINGEVLGTLDSLRNEGKYTQEIERILHERTQ